MLMFFLKKTKNKTCYSGGSQQEEAPKLQGLFDIRAKNIFLHIQVCVKQDHSWELVDLIFE